MKPLTGLILSSALIAFSCAVGCNSPTTKTEQVSHATNLESVTFFVDGMI